MPSYAVAKAVKRRAVIHRRKRRHMPSYAGEMLFHYDVKKIAIQSEKEMSIYTRFGAGQGIGFYRSFDSFG